MNRINPWLRSLAGPVQFSDDEIQRRSSLLNAVIWPSLAIAVVLGIGLAMGGAPWTVLATVGLMIAVILVTIAWMRSGKVNAAARLFVFAGWMVTALPAFLQDGLSSPYLLFSIVIVLMASLLLERRYVQIVTFMSLLEATLLLINTSYPIVPQLISTSTPLRRWAALAAVLLAISVIVQLTMENLKATIESARQNQERLTDANRLLEENRAVLERRVSERTEALEQRAHRLQTAAEVAGVVTTIRSLDRLLPEIVHTLADQFDYYHVGIYLAEDDGLSLRLAAANTQAGRALIERGFRLLLEETSLATSAANLKQARVAVDVSTDTQYKAMEELALTRSEICVPLIVSDRLLGVLDLQDTQVRAPSSDDLATLRILANQIAVAIENAELFSSNQKSIESLQRAYGALSSEGWQKVLRAQPDLGFRAGAAGTPAPAAGAWPPEMAAARKQERVVLADEFTLAVPIKIREQPVGVVRLRKPQEAGPWAADEISLVQTLSDRLSTALESARLYEETRRRAERERLTGEITARIRASNDPQTILQTAAHELRKALQADRAQLVIQAAVEEPSRDS